MMNKQFKYRSFLLELLPTSTFPASHILHVVVSCLAAVSLVDLNLNNITVETMSQDVNSGQMYQLAASLRPMLHLHLSAACSTALLYRLGCF